MGSPNVRRFMNSCHFKFVLTVTDLLSTSSVLQVVFTTPVDNVLVNSDPLTSAHLKVGYSSKYRRAAYRSPHGMFVKDQSGMKHFQIPMRQPGMSAGVY